MRRARVASCLADVTQQIHSLRASGVKLSQQAAIAGSEQRAAAKSAGSLCTVPDASDFEDCGLPDFRSIVPRRPYSLSASARSLSRFFSMPFTIQIETS